MRYHNISKCDMNNGEGIRVVLWVSGCEHCCEECHNEKTWDYNSGIEFDASALDEIIEELEKDYVSGITFSGGDPLAPYNREMTMALVNWVRINYPHKTIWVYTGYKYEQLVFEGNFANTIILKSIDVLVDGKYEKDLRDTSLKWRGSRNQRVIDVKKSLEKGEAVLHCD